MARVTIKLEGIPNLKKLLKEKNTQIIDGGQNVIERHNQRIINLAKSKIKSKTGEMASLLKSKIDGKSKTYVVSHVGPYDATKEQAIAWNSYEYGHAAPGKAGGTKVVAGSKVLRSSIKEDKASFKADMKAEIKSIIEG